MNAGRASVVLLHGLWMHGWVMTYLAARLRRAGFPAMAFDYHSLWNEIDRNAEALGLFLESLNAPRVHLVGHSLGGLVAMRYLALSRNPRVHRCVLLGAPVGGNRIGARLADSQLGRLFLGASAPLWSADMPDLAIDARYEVGVVIGTRRIGAGAVLFADRSAGDGVVRIEEAEYVPARDRIELNVSHSGMLISSRVAHQVAAFLERGAFDR